MKEDQEDRVRELQLKISHWSAEYEHSIEQQRQSQKSLQRTLSSAAQVAILASIPAIIWIVIWCSTKATRRGSSLWDQFVTAFVILTLYGLISAAAARGSSLFAHWWFRAMHVHERRAATLLTLIAQIVIFGWVVLVFDWT